ncbi:MAG: alkaline phosphatase family protein, partial [Thermoanaerobaculia bacterium]
ADWELLSELAGDGRIPNLAALMRGGATASMQTIQPTVSPLVWATAATGVPPDRHGVIDFLDRTSNRPVDAMSRRAPAIWDIAESFGRHAAVVSWWTAWPPMTTGTAVFDAPPQLQRNSFYPRTLEPHIKRAEVPVETIGFGQVGRFINITEREYEAAVAGGSPDDPVNMMRELLAKTWTDHRAGVSIYQQEKPMLMLMSYDGTDVVNHLAAPYHPPYREGIPNESFRKYWPTVANYYSEVDRLIGEWMTVLTDDTTVIVMSAHGFRWGKTRPRLQPIGRAALSDHRNPGVFIAYGNHVVPSRANRTITLYDVVPTILAILGLPKSNEMPGSMASWALDQITPVESVRVVSYNEFFAQRPVPGMPGIDAKPFTRSLQAVGHLIDPNRSVEPMLEEEERAAQVAAQPLPPQQWGAYAFYNNAGVAARRAAKPKEAAEAFQKAIDLNPSRPTPYLNLAMALFDRQQYTAADQVFMTAVGKGLPDADRWIVDFAALYRSQNMTSRAIQLLYQGRRLFPHSPVIAANLGSALAQAERYTEALPELERALGLEPTSALVLNNLGTFYAKKEDYARALDFWNRSLAIDPRQPEVRNAANAAQSHL